MKLFQMVLFVFFIAGGFYSFLIGEDSRGKNGIPKCGSIPQVSNAEWIEIEVPFEILPRGTGVRGEWPSDFKFILPPCFSEYDRKVFYHHGGKAWKCGDSVIEITFGYWGRSSFGKETEKCQIQINGMNSLFMSRRINEGINVLVLYEVDNLGLEPVLSGWSPNLDDIPMLNSILLSGSYFDSDKKK